VTASGDIAPEYVAARTVLLDALDALRAHRHALIIVGAQAVYLRTGSAGLTVAPFTTDGDLALDPATLSRDPRLDIAMGAAGFTLMQRPDGAVQPGRWTGTATVAERDYQVSVDLMVPAGGIAGGNTRGARLPDHGNRAAMRTPGLEAVLVDRDLLQVHGLDVGDARVVEVLVAGAAALLVAKTIKLSERVAGGRPHRLKDKDAGDVTRLVRSTPVGVMAERLVQLRRSPVAGASTEAAIAALASLFGRPRSPGVVMAVRALALDLPALQVEAQLPAYVGQLIRLLS